MSQNFSREMINWFVKNSYLALISREIIIQLVVMNHMLAESLTWSEYIYHHLKKTVIWMVGYALESFGKIDFSKALNRTFLQRIQNGFVSRWISFSVSEGEAVNPSIYKSGKNWVSNEKPDPSAEIPNPDWPSLVIHLIFAKPDTNPS